MTDAPMIPFRPRLADHALLRRYHIKGVERLLIIDAITDDVLEIEANALDLIRCADGTRDLGGIILTAVRRGAYRRASEVTGLLAELAERGLLTDGIEPGLPPNLRCPERPLEVIPGYSLHCDANGSCCGTYSAVALSPDEAQRARALLPEILNTDADRSRGFLPVQSSVELHALAITMVDGHCPYLADDGRCRIQLVAGPEAKPRGCRIFPATFVDDGRAVRVSVAVECPCVLASLGLEGGGNLLPSGAAVEADLIPGSPIVRLPEIITVSESHRATRDELRTWSKALVELTVNLDDPLAAFWCLADAVREAGLSPEAAREVLRGATPPPSISLGFPLMKLASIAQAKEEMLRHLGADATDRTSQLALWLSRGAQELLKHDAVDHLLEAPPQFPGHERFYFRATLFGHHLVATEMTIEQALRDRALRLLLARQLGSDVPEECADHPAAAYPITAVESMMRGQGLDRYARPVEPP
jgi:lysine-N-methylase